MGEWIEERETAGQRASRKRVSRVAEKRKVIFTLRWRAVDSFA